MGWEPAAAQAMGGGGGWVKKKHPPPSLTFYQHSCHREFPAGHFRGWGMAKPKPLPLKTHSRKLWVAVVEGSWEENKVS